MEIGGCDFVLRFKRMLTEMEQLELMHAIDTVVHHAWPNRVDDRVPDDLETHYFLYVNEAAKTEWDKLGCVPETDDTMMQVIVDREQLTLVTAVRELGRTQTLAHRIMDVVKMKFEVENAEA